MTMWLFQPKIWNGLLNHKPVKNKQCSIFKMLHCFLCIIYNNIADCTVYYCRLTVNRKDKSG